MTSSPSTCLWVHEAMQGYLAIVGDSVIRRRTVLRKDLEQIVCETDMLGARLEGLRIAANNVLNSLGETPVEDYVENAKKTMLEPSQRTKLEAVCSGRRVFAGIKQTEQCAQDLATELACVQEHMGGITSATVLTQQVPSWCCYISGVREEVDSRLIALVPEN